MAEETIPAEKATYIGSDKIAMVAIGDLKTPMGSDMVEITFENGRKETMPKKTYELVVTDVASDATIVQRTKFNQMIPAVKAVICEYDLKVSEIQTFLQMLANGIDDNFSRATNYAWTKNDELYIPGMNPLSIRSLLDAHAIIQSIPQKVEAPVEVKKESDGNVNDSGAAAA